MTTPFKKRFWRLFKWSGAVFLAMFVFRFIYGYYATTGYYEDQAEVTGDFFSNVTSMRKNYASEKMAFSANVEARSDAASSQKYEKTAVVRSKSSDFEKDEKTIREKTKGFSAMIQYEQNQGNKGNRTLHLSIGVTPEKFDEFYSVVKGIGSVKATEVTKVDKTNEYRQLNAKKASLQKTLESLVELKSKAGAISDFVSLHDKILETESQLQELGVELGNFNTENEFCTVNFSIYEGAEKQEISTMHRIRVALEWTIRYFAVLTGAVLCLSASIFIILLVVEKLKLLNIINNKTKE